MRRVFETNFFFHVGAFAGGVVTSVFLWVRVGTVRGIHNSRPEYRLALNVHIAPQTNNGK